MANVYLHYVFDLWAHRWRQHEARGAVVFVRYADDVVAGFEHEGTAKRFLADIGSGWQSLRYRCTRTRRD